MTSPSTLTGANRSSPFDCGLAVRSFHLFLLDLDFTGFFFFPWASALLVSTIAASTTDCRHSDMFFMASWPTLCHHGVYVVFVRKKSYLASRLLGTFLSWNLRRAHGRGSLVHSPQTHVVQHVRVTFVHRDCVLDEEPPHLEARSCFHGSFPYLIRLGQRQALSRVS